MESCSTCRHWKVIGGTNSREGNCRRFPPVEHRDPSAEVTHRQPITAAEDSCGEFSRFVPFEGTNLSVRAVNTLVKAGFRNLEEVALRGEAEIAGLDDLIVEQVKEAIDGAGLAFTN